MKNISETVGSSIMESRPGWYCTRNAAILDNPLEEGADNIFIVNAPRTPKHGTHIEFILKVR